MTTMVWALILFCSAVIVYLAFFTRHSLWSRNFLDEGEAYNFRLLKTTHPKPKRCPVCNSGNLSGYLGAYRKTVRTLHRRPDATKVVALEESILDDRGYNCLSCDRFFSSEPVDSDDC